MHVDLCSGTLWSTGSYDCQIIIGSAQRLCKCKGWIFNNSDKKY